jgi:hypothetical protein
MWLNIYYLWLSHGTQLEATNADIGASAGKKAFTNLAAASEQ